MVLAGLLFFTSVAISTVAIYYSVVGLAAIFAAAVIPIIIMGTTLEVSKLVAAWWLKWNWYRAPALLKYYLLFAVIVLMLITSMGIFGFLSKAHIEQTLASSQSFAQIERIDAEIARQQFIADRSEARLRQLETSGSSTDLNIQQQIDIEQQRIENAYARVQPSINEQQQIIDNQFELLLSRIQTLENEVLQLQQLIDQNQITQVQSIVGTRADGRWGPATENAVRQWQEQRSTERQSLLARIDQLNESAVVVAAREEISRIRRGVEDQIDDSNRLIARLRSQLGQDNAANLDEQLITEQERISSAFNQIELLSLEKFTLESEFRKLEAEVGPIKYIATFIYGEEASQSLLEKAVTWVIILIIFVFDPLAVLLLLASQVSLRWHLEEQAALESKPVIEDLPIEANDDVVEESDSKKEDELINKGTELNNKEVEKPLNKLDNGIIPVNEEQLDCIKQSVKNVVIDGNNEPIEYDETDFEDDEDVSENIKLAKKSWKIDNPNDSLKHQRKLLESGMIKELPWMLPPYNLEKVSWMENEDGHQIKKESFIQNQKLDSD